MGALLLLLLGAGALSSAVIILAPGPTTVAIVGSKRPVIYAKIGETFSIRGILKGADRKPQDLTQAQAVTFRMRPKGGGSPIYDGTALQFVADATGAVSYDSPTVLDAVSTPPGLYELEISARFPGNIIRKFPNGGPLESNKFVLVNISEAA